MTEREPGFYWVWSDAGWSVARWSGVAWRRIGSATLHIDEDFLEIGERVERTLPSHSALDRLIELHENAQRLLAQAVELTKKASQQL